MIPIDDKRYLILVILVIAWCAVHSALISVSVTEYFRKRLGARFRLYRLFFNLIAVVTLIPVAIFGYSARSQVVFSWHGYLRIGQVLLLAAAVLLFLLGMRHYDAWQFLGIKQIREGTANRAMTESGELDTSGILGIIRHPWYLATLLLVWARLLDVSALLVNSIITVYVLVGIHLEEKKLVREFGEQYLAYQQRVSMLIPFAWLKEKMN